MIDVTMSGISSWETAFSIEWVVVAGEWVFRFSKKLGDKIEEGVGKEAIVSIRLVFILYLL